MYMAKGSPCPNISWKVYLTANSELLLKMCLQSYITILPYINLPVNELSLDISESVTLLAISSK